MLSDGHAREDGEMLPLPWPAYRRTAAGRRSAGARDKDWDRMADVTMDIASNGSLQTAELDALVIGAGFAGLYQLLCLRDRLGLSVKALEAGSARPRHGVRHTGSDGTRWECADAERCQAFPPAVCGKTSGGGADQGDRIILTILPLLSPCLCYAAPTRSPLERSMPYGYPHERVDRRPLPDLRGPTD
jgi:hypothetical protein